VLIEATEKQERVAAIKMTRRAAETNVAGLRDGEDLSGEMAKLDDVFEPSAEDVAEDDAEEDASSASQELTDVEDTGGPILGTSADLPKASEDPIRMYLSQMAEIPLLSREEEISLAKKIEITRKTISPLVCSKPITRCGRPSTC